MANNQRIVALHIKLFMVLTVGWAPDIGCLAAIVPVLVLQGSLFVQCCSMTAAELRRKVKEKPRRGGLNLAERLVDFQLLNDFVAKGCCKELHKWETYYFEVDPDRGASERFFRHSYFA